MNLLNGGTINCFLLSRFFLRKQLVFDTPFDIRLRKRRKGAVASLDLPIVKSKCPAYGVTERQSTKELLASLEKQYPALREKNRGCTAKRRNKRLVTKSKCEKVLYLPYYNDIILLI